MEQEEKNRALQSLSGASISKLEETVIATIWGWATHKKSFFDSGSVTAAGPVRSSAGASPILDSVCTLLKQVQEQTQINTIRRRLLLYFLARFVDGKIKDVRDMDRVVTLVVDSGWISPEPELLSLLKENLPRWLKAGRRYVGLVHLMNAGLGVLIFLPLLTDSTWESHCPRTGMYVDAILEKLRSMGVPEEANAKRHGDLTGDDIVRELWEELFAQSSVNFVACNPATVSPSTGGVRFIRKPRDLYSQPRDSPGDFSSDSERWEPESSADSPSPTDTPGTSWSEFCRVFTVEDPPVDPRLHTHSPQAVA